MLLMWKPKPPNSSPAVNLLAKLIFFHGTAIANGKSGQSNLASDIEAASR